MTIETTVHPAKPKRPKKAKIVKKADKPAETVELAPGYRGLIALALSSGQVTSMNVQAVHRNDRFDYAYGLDERLEHVPAAGDRGDVTHFYAYVKLKEGGHCFEVLSRAEVDATRDWNELGKEMAVRRLAGYLPLALQKAAALHGLGEIVSNLSRPAQPEELPQAEGPVRVPAPEPEPQAVSLTEEELAGLFPPGHIMRILDAAAERDMPDEVLAEIVGSPLDEIPPEDEPVVLRTIASWQR